MPLVDQQLRHNDCGISAIKTVLNIHGTDIPRTYIEERIQLSEKGARFDDLKKFFDEQQYSSEFRILDLNSSSQVSELRNLMPFILPIKRRDALHYVVVNGQKGKKFKVLDPSLWKTSFLSIQELKKVAHNSKNFLELSSIEEKITAILTDQLSAYDIKLNQLLASNDVSTAFNKLSYFNYHKNNFGFQDTEAEQSFLKDLFFNQDINLLPKGFRNLQMEEGLMRVQAPLILSVPERPVKSSSGEPTSIEDKNIYVRLFKKLQNNRKIWFIYLFSAFVASSTTQLAVFINQILIDNILPSFRLNLLILFALGLGVFRLFDLLISQYKNFVAIHLGNIIDRFFLVNFDDKLNSFSLEYIQSFKKGDLTERIGDALKLKAFFLRFFTKILVDSLVSIYSLGILFLISWKLALIVCSVVALYIIWFNFISPYLRSNEQKRFLAKADLISKIIEKIDNIQVIKSLKLEAENSSRILPGINRLIQIQTRVRYVNLLNTFVISLVTTTAGILIIIFLAKNAIENQSISIGQILTFILLSQRVFKSLSTILKENLSLQEHNVILKRYFNFEDRRLTKTLQVNKDGNTIQDFKIRSFELKDLSFGYHNEKLILSNVSLGFSLGDKLMIQGRNGSGKSTLCKVLAGLYKIPNSGQIKINNNDISFYDQAKIREKILIITNEDLLFNDTLEFNITLGKQFALERIIRIAKEIGFYDFVMSKPEKLNYMVNEHGKNLSTGQRKKILIMRAILSKAEIIILDEVLAGIDKGSREKIEQFVNRKTRRSFIIISHESVYDIQFDKTLKLTNGTLIPL